MAAPLPHNPALKGSSWSNWIALLPAMSITFLASLLYFVAFSGHPAARVIYTASKVVTLVWPVFCVVFIFRTGLPRLDLGDRRHLRAIPGGVVVGLLIVGLMAALMQTPMAGVIEEGGEKIRAKAEGFGVMKHFWAFALLLTFGNSLYEEYFWRWFVYGRLRKAMPRSLAVALAGASFAAHHIVVACQFFPLLWGVLLGCSVGVGGAIWCVMYDWQKTLAGAWVSHIIVDLGIFYIGYRILFP